MAARRGRHVSRSPLPCRRFLARGAPLPASQAAYTLTPTPSRAPLAAPIALVPSSSRPRPASSRPRPHLCTQRCLCRDPGVRKGASAATRVYAKVPLPRPGCTQRCLCRDPGVRKGASAATRVVRRGASAATGVYAEVPLPRAGVYVKAPLHTPGRPAAAGRGAPQPGSAPRRAALWRRWCHRGLLRGARGRGGVVSGRWRRRGGWRRRRGRPPRRRGCGLSGRRCWLRRRAASTGWRARRGRVLPRRGPDP